MILQLRCIFAYRTIIPADLWIELLETIDSLGRVSPQYTLDGKPREPGDIESILRSCDVSHFSISDDRFEFDFCPIARHRFDQLIVTANHGDLGNADLWVETLAAVNMLIQAFLVNRVYDYWQNATDPLEYETRQRQYDHLPMKSNGLPPPLDQMVIDVSGNPGRWSLRNGYLEAVSNPIWLGDRFWALAGVDRASVLRSDVWLHVRQLDDGLVCLHSHDGQFESDDDVQGPLQNRIRSLLYSSAT